jgi:hypothetical protein
MTVPTGAVTAVWSFNRYLLSAQMMQVEEESSASPGEAPSM